MSFGRIQKLTNHLVLSLSSSLRFSNKLNVWIMSWQILFKSTARVLLFKFSWLNLYIFFMFEMLYSSKYRCRWLWIHLRARSFKNHQKYHDIRGMRINKKEWSIPRVTKASFYLTPKLFPATMIRQNLWIPAKAGLVQKPLSNEIANEMKFA